MPISYDIDCYTSIRNIEEKNVPIEIIRKIQGDGSVFVFDGTEVMPADILGEGYVSRGYRVFNIAKILGIVPEEVEKYVNKEVGAKVFKDEILAKKKKLLGTVTRQFIVPCDGVIEDLNKETGSLTIRFFPEKMKLISGFYGKVSKVENKEITIKTRVDYIKGQIGIGVPREGIFKIVPKKEETVLASDITSEYTKKIIFVGGLVTKDLIHKSIVLGVKGIIGCGINARDYYDLVGSLNQNEDVGISLLLIDGFASGEFSEDLLNLFEKYQNRHIIIEPQQKRLVIPLSPEEWKNHKHQDKEVEELKKEIRFEPLIKGKEVLFLCWPYVGKKGIIEEVFDDEKNHLKMVKVNLEQHKEIITPARNLEIIS